MSRHLLVVNPASMGAGTINTCKLKVVKGNSRKGDKVQAGAELTSTTIYSDFPDKGRCNIRAEQIEEDVENIYDVT